MLSFTSERIEGAESIFYYDRKAKIYAVQQFSD